MPRRVPLSFLTVSVERKLISGSTSLFFHKQNNRVLSGIYTILVRTIIIRVIQGIMHASFSYTLVHSCAATSRKYMNWFFFPFRSNKHEKIQESKARMLLCLGLRVVLCSLITLVLNLILLCSVFKWLSDPICFPWERLITHPLSGSQVVDTQYLVNPEWKNFIPGYMYNDSDLELTAESLYRQSKLIFMYLGDSVMPWWWLWATQPTPHWCSLHFMFKFG